MVNCWRCYCITNERVMNLSIFLLARLESCDSEHSLAAGAMPALRLLSNLLPAEADVPRCVLSSTTLLGFICRKALFVKAAWRRFSKPPIIFNLNFHCCGLVTFCHSISFCIATTLPPTITLSNYTSLASRTIMTRVTRLIRPENCCPACTQCTVDHGQPPRAVPASEPQK